MVIQYKVQADSHASLEGTEVVHLRAKHKVGQLGVGHEDDEEHDGEAQKVPGTARHGAGQLTHRPVQGEELEQLREGEREEESRGKREEGREGVERGRRGEREGGRGREGGRERERGREGGGRGREREREEEREEERETGREGEREARERNVTRAAAHGVNAD